MKYGIILLSILFSFDAISQNDIALTKIRNLQVIQHDDFYNKGLFPSQRVNMNYEGMVEDNNIFFTGLILYTLKEIQDSVTTNNQILFDSIFNNSIDNFKFYKNRNDGCTYNFYQVRPVENPFPNSKFLPNSSKRQIADDLDDTSIIYLTQNSSDSVNNIVRSKMIEHSTKKIYTSTYKQYRNSNVYKTWFSEKMKQDIDICVLSNVLVFMFEKNLPMTSIDTASYELIKSAIKQNFHLNNGQLISSHYQKPSIILYHIARLIAIVNSPLINEIRSKIIGDIHQKLESSSNSMEKVILLTSLFRLGEKVDFEINYLSLQNDMNNFYWFKANPFYGSRFWIRKLVGNSNFFQNSYKCEAYYWSLVLELDALSNASFFIDDKRHTTMYKKH